MFTQVKILYAKLLSAILVAIISFLLIKKTKQKLLFGSLVIIFTLISLHLMLVNSTQRFGFQKPLNETDLSSAAELASIPQPTNVRAFPDDRVATIAWTPVTNSNVVGYYLKWGKKSLGTFTDAKQTIHSITQIQPLENGVEYIVQVQSVQGTITHKPTTSEQGGSDSYATANGNLSPPVALSITPSSAKVDAMRARLTGFFDDFNLSAGGFDETKWNHATTACVDVGEDGQFINSQFHAHNMARSTCDRAGNVSRPRGIFDITGKTESDPGQIEFDFDGVTQPRDVWYIDIIPTDVRKNGMPLDITSHNDATDADHEDPGRMLRITQYYDKLVFHYYDSTNNPHSIGLSNVLCPNWDGTAGIQGCSTAGRQSTQFNPLGEISAPISVIANVRRHWVIQFSPQKIKVFIDGALMAEGITPGLFANIKKYQIHSTLFTYNTGKQFTVVGPTTSMLHWDNFGFNGPASSIVTHNYIDGGSNGATPLLSRGYKGAAVPSGNRSTKIPIPDPIGTPVRQARLMFTIQPFGYSSYTWGASQEVTVNGKVYPVPNPALNMQNPKTGPLAETYVPNSTGIFVSPADLRQGINDISFTLGSDILNAHIEIDYDKNNAPPFTQPRNIFPNLSAAITPVMRSNDMYWFVEQDMGLPALSSGGILPSTNPTATAPPTIGAAYTIQPIPGYTSTKDTLTVGKQIYLDEPRFTFFGIPAFLQNISYVKTSNVSIKENTTLSWKITLNQRAEVYVLHRKIPGQTAPTWITSAYSRVTNDDFSNVNQFLLRKNEQGLIGLYDIYKSTPVFNGTPVHVTFGPASDATHTAFSMYMVGVKPL